MNDAGQLMGLLPTHRFTNPGDFEAAIARASGGTGVAPLRSRDFEVSLTLAQLPRTAMFLVDACYLRGAREAAGDLWSVAMPLQGGFSAAVGGHSHYRDFGSGDFHLLHQDRDFGLRILKPTKVLVANVLSDDLAQKAASLIGSPTGEPVEVISAASESGGALQRFAQHFWTELQRPGGLWDSPLALAEMEDCLVTFLSLAAVDPQRHKELRANRDSARRAEEFLMRHLTRPVSRSDLATATGVSIRTVSRIFHERYGVGPLAWLRQRRLEAVHRELLAAQPGKTTVTAVALRYGFEHLGRFAANYTRAFGENPSATLRR